LPAPHASPYTTLFRSTRSSVPGADGGYRFACAQMRPRTLGGSALVFAGADLDAVEQCALGRWDDAQVGVGGRGGHPPARGARDQDRKSTRLNSSHVSI